MTPEQFVYWLHGYFELQEKDNSLYKGSLNASQVDMIKDHLNKVFNHERKFNPNANNTFELGDVIPLVQFSEVCPSC